MATELELRDPTHALTRKTWTPMSPEELDALRPPRVKPGEHESPAALAYRCGISALESAFYRLSILEEQVEKLQALLHETREAHDRNMHAIDARHKTV